MWWILIQHDGNNRFIYLFFIFVFVYLIHFCSIFSEKHQKSTSRQASAQLHFALNIQYLFRYRRKYGHLFVCIWVVLLFCISNEWFYACTSFRECFFFFCVWDWFLFEWEGFCWWNCFVFVFGALTLGYPMHIMLFHVHVYFSQFIGLVRKMLEIVMKVPVNQLASNIFFKLFSIVLKFLFFFLHTIDDDIWCGWTNIKIDFVVVLIGYGCEWWKDDHKMYLFNRLQLIESTNQSAFNNNLSTILEWYNCIRLIRLIKYISLDKFSEIQTDAEQNQ